MWILATCTLRCIRMKLKEIDRWWKIGPFPCCIQSDWALTVRHSKKSRCLPSLDLLNSRWLFIYFGLCWNVNSERRRSAVGPTHNTSIIYDDPCWKLEHCHANCEFASVLCLTSEMTQAEMKFLTAHSVFLFRVHLEKQEACPSLYYLTALTVGQSWSGISEQYIFFHSWNEWVFCWSPELKLANKSGSWLLW